MKRIKYNCEAEETTEQKAVRGMSIHTYSGVNPEHDKDTSDNRIKVAETLNRALAQRERIKRAIKKERKPDAAKKGDIMFYECQNMAGKRKFCAG